MDLCSRVRIREMLGEQASWSFDLPALQQVHKYLSLYISRMPSLLDRVPTACPIPELMGPPQKLWYSDHILSALTALII